MLACANLLRVKIKLEATMAFAKVTEKKILNVITAHWKLFISANQAELQ